MGGTITFLIVAAAVIAVLSIGRSSYLDRPLDLPEFQGVRKALKAGDLDPLLDALAALRASDPSEADLLLASVADVLPAAAACELADAQPDAPLHHCVAAQSLIAAAWAARGDHWGESVSPADFDHFQMFLRDAERHLDAADRLRPDYATADFVRLKVHRGLEHPPADSLATLERIRRRSPLHYAAHRDALANISWKWGGDNAAMQQPAQRWAASAPDGHPMRALGIAALGEQLLKASYEEDLGGISSPCDRLTTAAAQIPDANARPSHRAWAEVARDLAMVWAWAGRERESKGAARLAQRLAAHFQ